MTSLVHKALFVLLAAAALTPYFTAPQALVTGLVFSLVFGNPFAATSKTLQTWLLQASVIGLGGAMNLAVVLRVGALGFMQTAMTLTATLGLAWVLTRWLSTDRTTSLLIAVGTAICGGSAIAAVAPVVGAKPQQTSVALGVVFLLNAVALLVFPPVGTRVGLSAPDFGLWSALAIHDTSSVVGASMQFGADALAVGTTVKLTRALWVLPLTLALARVWPQGETRLESPRKPWFILGFIALAGVMTAMPAWQPVGAFIAALSRQTLVLTLFLVGASVSKQALRAVGLKPVLLGVALWLVVAVGTLAALHMGLLQPPVIQG